MREEIIAKIKNAGVVGAGGAGFPTHVKVSATANTIVVNGAECEPLLRVDQQLMDVWAEKVIQGLEAVINITNAKEGIIALKGKHIKAFASLEKSIKVNSIRLHALDDFYPAGDEHVTVYETTENLVPQGAIPLKVNCIVINVETLLNIANALAGKPVTHTYLTITGEVSQPVTLRLPIGTSIQDSLELAGVKVTEEMGVIEGGPMMGKIVEDLAQPITKTTKGLIVLPREHQLIRKRSLTIEKMVKQSKAACIQCRYCTDLCPRYLLGHELEPHKIMRSIQHIQSTEATMKMALLCSECGICEQYACIMDLSPRTINSMLKRELSKNGIKQNEPPENQQVSRTQEHRKIPVKRLISRLGLLKYDKAAALNETDILVDKVRIGLHQHIGTPSIPVVKVGQRVQLGDIIAEVPEKSLGATVHASITGVVTEVSSSIVLSREKGSEKE